MVRKIKITDMTLDNEEEAPKDIIVEVIDEVIPEVIDEVIPKGIPEVILEATNNLTNDLTDDEINIIEKEEANKEDNILELKNKIIENIETKPDKIKSYNQIACPNCNKYMSARTLKYTHEKFCQPDKPIKPKLKHTNTEQIVRIQSEISKMNKAISVKAKEEIYVKKEIPEVIIDKIETSIKKNTVKFTEKNYERVEEKPRIDYIKIKNDKLKHLTRNAF